MGVLESKGGSGFGNQDNQIMIPLTTGQIRVLPRTPRNQVDQILIQVTTPEQVTATGDEITHLLQDRAS